MVKWALALFLLVSPVNLVHATNAPPEQTSDLSAIRAEFNDLFGGIRIYQVIQHYLPERYEEFFHSFAAAKRSGDLGQLKTSAFINQIRNTHLKKSSDPTILAFYRHIIETGRKIYAQNPDAAFSYIFGGSPKDYAVYVDFQGEMEYLGQLFEQLLSSSSQENLLAIDRAEADNGMTLVFLDLHYRYGEKMAILEQEDYGTLSAADRSALCDIYLSMHEQIFELESPTRSHVLRSFALKL